MRGDFIVQECKDKLWYDAASLAASGVLVDCIILSFEYIKQTVTAWLCIQTPKPVAVNEAKATDTIWLEFENAIIHEPGNIGNLSGSVSSVVALNQWQLSIYLASTEEVEPKVISIHSDQIYLRMHKIPDDYNTIIVESEHYIIRRQYEEANLLFKTVSRNSICIGDHYGDVSCAAINPNEEWCITCGAGIIFYHLIEPFETYTYGHVTSQWREYGRDPDDVDYIKCISEITNEGVTVLNEDDERETFRFQQTRQ